MRGGAGGWPRVSRGSMNRRKFFDQSVKAGAAAVWAGAARTFGKPRPLCPPSPRGPFPSANAQGRHLIIPTDVPDHFNLKVMEFNSITAPDPEKWELEVSGLVEHPLKLRLKDLAKLLVVTQSSRLKCVQCWSARILWDGFRASELFKIIRPKASASWMRVDCADLYYDYHSMKDLLHPHTMFAVGMYGKPLTPEHGAPLRLVLPFKYGYKSSKLITKITMTTQGGQGVVADTWPYYSQTGDIEPGYDHPFDYPSVTKKVNGGEITDY